MRSCDGGFFPLGVSARGDSASLTEMCHALCPGTETAVYTRNPDSDIKTAVGIDGKPYMDLPNALKFQKALATNCSCRAPGKSWAESLANAEEVLDNVRKGDVIITKEKSDALSRPNLDAKQRAAILKSAPADGGSVDKATVAADERHDGSQASQAAGPAAQAARPRITKPNPALDDDEYDDPRPSRRGDDPPF